MKLTISRLITLSLLPSALFAASTDLVFEEINGTVAIEAEHFQSQTENKVRSWHLVTNAITPDIKPDGDPSHAADASGGAYLEILPDTRRSHGDKLIPGENFINTPGKMAILTYHVKFSTPGRYYCWVRTHSTNTEDNGIHLGVNGTWPESGARMQWIAKNKWHWDSKQRTQKVHVGVFGQIWIDIPKPGLHKVHFSMREDGFEFDKFILTTAKPDKANPPKGTGPATKLAKGKPGQRSFPAHWGKPPRIQTRDIVDLPAGYGRGSSTLRNWIQKNIDADLKKKTSVKLEARDFPAKGGFYLDQGKWLAIHPEKHKEAQTDTTFPYPSGTYNVTLLGVGENDGEASHEVLSNGSSILKFKIPLSKDTFETGEKYNKTVPNVKLNTGDVLTLKSKVASADGKEYSRARMAGLVFEPADDATLLKVKADKKVNNASQNSSNKTAQKPKLQQPRKPDGNGAVKVSGNLTQWQPVTLTLDGPFAHELDNAPNPFRDYSFTVTFTHESGSPEYHVPGYFAADGKAGESSAQSGIKWRAHLSPDKPGTWTYQTHFLKGKDLALLPPAEFPDKEQTSLKTFTKSGSFKISPTPKDAPGFYSHGRLSYVDKRYLRFAGSQKYFLKVGADAPETLLGYADFDGTIARKKNVPLKTWKPHLRDWKQGDPTWKNGKGKGLIGALNYLSGKGMNAFSFLPYNAGGDGDNVWPFVSRNEKFHYDCSKLDQWNIIFNHAQAKGLFLHFKLQETEMDDLDRGHGGKRAKHGNVPTALDKGDLGPERKLYLREIVARFGHHLALNWNLGEENTQTTKQQVDMANYLRDVDPYDHHLVIHTFPGQQDTVYKPLLGEASPLTGASLQNSALKDCHWQVVKWTKAAAKAGKPWCVAFDEPGNAHFGMPADPDYPGMPSRDQGYKGPTVDQTRKHTLWGVLMAGGWGVEYYFGYKLPQNDLICEDWRSRDQSWTYGKIALDCFAEHNIPFWDMESRNDLVGNPQNKNTAYCLAQKGNYAIYFPHGGKAILTPLKGDTVKSIRWVNPRTGDHSDILPLNGTTITAPDAGDWLAIVK